MILGYDLYIHYNDKRLMRDGLNLYDFHARQYDPALGLFDRPDPMAAEYPWINPYLYCAANPVMNVDPTGKSLYSLDGSRRIWHVLSDEFVGLRDDYGNEVDPNMVSLNIQLINYYLGELTNTNSGLSLLQTVIGSSINFIIGFNESIPNTNEQCAFFDNKNNHISICQTIGNNCGITYDPVSGAFDNIADNLTQTFHELAHASDKALGIFDNKNYQTFIDRNGVIHRYPQSEVSAIRQENAFRMEAGMPLRISYSTYLTDNIRQSYNYMPFSVCVKPDPRTLRVK